MNPADPFLALLPPILHNTFSSLFSSEQCPPSFWQEYRHGWQFCKAEILMGLRRFLHGTGATLLRFEFSPRVITTRLTQQAFFWEKIPTLFSVLYGRNPESPTRLTIFYPYGGNSDAAFHYWRENDKGEAHWARLWHSMHQQFCILMAGILTRLAILAGKWQEWASESGYSMHQ